MNCHRKISKKVGLFHRKYGSTEQRIKFVHENSDYLGNVQRYLSGKANPKLSLSRRNQADSQFCLPQYANFRLLPVAR
jgi:hypothetical protein